LHIILYLTEYGIDAWDKYTLYIVKSYLPDDWYYVKEYERKYPIKW
jgi:hypothetical protein